MHPVGSASTVRVFKPSTLAVALACAFGATLPPAQAQPTGATAVHGAVSLSQPSASHLVVTTSNGAGTAHSVVNWQSFSVPGGTQTSIVQPSSTSLSINRVTTPNNPSLIYGTLSSNGQVLLVNPAGVTVGAGAVVDTAGFQASTLALSEADAIAGRLRFEGGGGELKVQGQVVAREGDVVLLAPQVTVEAGGVVRAPNGSVVLAAGQRAELTGRGLEGIQLQVQAPTDRAVNLGTLQGDAVGIFAGTLRHSGVIQATAVSAEGGRVVLKAQEAAALDGSVRAVRGDQGGVVHATARQVTVGAAAVLDVSGSQGGGELLVGGGWQGKDGRLANAESTVVATGAQLRADALDSGDGGTVVVWADGATLYGGHISARGGANGGDGGRAEVSGKQYLAFRGSADLSAASGQKGVLLLDPLNLEIGVVADLDGSGGGSDDLGGDILSSDNPGVTSKITSTALNLLLNTTNVSLAATNWIYVNDDIAPTGSNELTLNGGTGIELNADIGGISRLNLVAGTGGVIQAGGTAISTDLTLTSSGNVSLTGNNAIQYIDGTLSNGASLTLANAGSTTLTVEGLTVAGNLTVTGTNLAVNQTNALVVSGTTALNVGTGSVNLTNAGNDFNVLGSTSVGNFFITDANAIKLNAITSTGNVDVDAAGAITRNAGTVSSNGSITLSGSSIGSAADYLSINPGGQANLTLTGSGGGLYVSQASGTLTTSSYNIQTGGGAGSTETVKLAAADIYFDGFNSMSGGLGNDAITLTATSNNVLVASGLSFTAQSVDLVAQAGSGLVTLGDTTGGVQFTTTGGVHLKTSGGNVTQTAPLTLSGGGGLTLTGGGNVTLDNAGNTLGTVSGSVSGAASLRGLTAVGANGLSVGGGATLVSGGALAINGALSSSSGNVSATATGALSVASAGSVSGSQITLAGTSIAVDGKLYPGRSGVAGGTLTLNGATTFGATSQLHIDFNGATYDSVIANNGANFLAGATLTANAISQPAVGDYTVVTGTTTGTLPTLAGTLSGASLAFGSLIVSVTVDAAAAQGTVTGLTQDYTPLFDQEVAGVGTNLLPEAVADPVETQALDDIIVDDVSCRPR